MGNVTSSLNIGTLESIANIIGEVRADPSAALDSLSSHGRTLASSVSDTFKDARQDPLAALHSLNKHGQNIVASLSVTAKEFGSSQPVADSLSVFRKNWYKAVAQLPVYLKKILTLATAWWIPFTATIVVLYYFGGFDRAGVRRNSPASQFQSRYHGGYTPKGGVFANSTSASMRGNTPMIYKVASAAVVAVYRSWTWK
ncbi:hypothetical protein BDZ45DRAFT_807000 [Acephala macrosclerotiorum]|nr:hypothetical protein BDZ45DRAFT_807000 [Acephala macrosclerotiorum]